MWEYRATVARVVDADTVDLQLDLGFHVYHRVRVRLARVDAPEMATPMGQAAKARVAELLPEGCAVLLASSKGDRYGRWVGEIVTASGVNVSTWLLDERLAVAYP